MNLTFVGDINQLWSNSLRVLLSSREAFLKLAQKSPYEPKAGEPP